MWTRKTLLLPAILLIVVTAAGCGSEAGQSAAQSTPVAPGPTFQVIKVTVPPDISSTPGDSSEEKTEAVSKGGLRQFPEILKQSEGLTIGPVISSWQRSEEHTSELQSRRNLVCRLLLEKKKKKRKSQGVCRKPVHTLSSSTESVSEY